MKKIVIIVVCMICVITSCKKVSPVIWDSVSITRNESGVIVDISYPFRFGGDTTSTNKINTQIEDYYKFALPEECEMCTLDSMINYVINSKSKDSLLFHMEYDLKGSGSVYVTDSITSVRLERAYYTGGANVNYHIAFLNFNNATGEIIPTDKLFNDMTDLTIISRDQFLKKREIAINTPKQETILFIEPSSVPLAANIGFDSTGVVFVYNMYEVAPRYFGSTEFTVPYTEIDSLIIKR